jgi:hypothetical protein
MCGEGKDLDFTTLGQGNHIGHAVQASCVVTVAEEQDDTRPASCPMIIGN